jgi:hypothetical protein
VSIPFSPTSEEEIPLVLPAPNSFHIGHLIEIVEAMKVNPVSVQNGKTEEPDLGESFLASVKHGIKPDIKMESC